LRPTGDSHRRTPSSPAKPRDAEAMDTGVAHALDDKLEKCRLEAGVKPVKAEERPEPALRRSV
jgi:hypothetical protein